MHMADALISPLVGGLGWAATIATTVYAAKRLTKSPNHEQKVPMMAVLAAFVFAAQMINFSIPGTGSSGHLGGGMLLAILLGPEAAFLAIASVLALQSLFFADGGLLALGCNIVNLGLIPCFLVYPWLYKPMAGDGTSVGRRSVAAFVSALVGLQLGAFGVVLQTVFSGISELPFNKFAVLMQSIHLGIGAVEGLVTVAVVGFLAKARPDILDHTKGVLPAKRSYKGLALGVLGAAVLTGGLLSWFASGDPDGLEWSAAKTAGTEEIHGASGESIHQSLKALQEKVAFLPDYDFAKAEAPQAEGAAPAAHEAAPAKEASVVNTGTSVSGIVGALLTMLVAGGIGWALRRRTSAHQHGAQTHSH